MKGKREEIYQGRKGREGGRREEMRDKRRREEMRDKR